MKFDGNANEDCLREYVYRLSSIARNPPLTGSYPQLHAVLAELWSKAWKSAMKTYGIPEETMNFTLCAWCKETPIRDRGHAFNKITLDNRPLCTNCQQKVMQMTGEKLEVE